MNNFKKGDWPCPSCAEINFASRYSCRKCGQAKAAQPTSIPPFQNNAVNIVPKPGDWNCSCGDLNFAFRTSCRKCGKPKASTSSVVAKPGDWKCSKCNDLNFAARTQCRTCLQQKPGTNQTKDSEKESSECVVCMEKPTEYVVTVCGHLALCADCGTQVDKCPMCRVPFTKEQLIKVYKA